MLTTPNSGNGGATGTTAVLPPPSAGDTFQGPRWVPEAADCPEPGTYYVFSYTYKPIIKLNLIN